MITDSTSAGDRGRRPRPRSALGPASARLLATRPPARRPSASSLQRAARGRRRHVETTGPATAAGRRLPAAAPGPYDRRAWRPWRSTSAARSSRPPWSTPAGGRPHRDPGPDAGHRRRRGPLRRPGPPRRRGPRGGERRRGRGRGVRGRLRGPDDRGRRRGLTAEHPGVAGVPAAPPARRPPRAGGRGRQRCQGARPRRGVVRRRRRRARLPGHGGVHRRRRGHRQRWAAAGGCVGQRRPHRPRLRRRRDRGVAVGTRRACSSRRPAARPSPGAPARRPPPPGPTSERGPASSSDGPSRRSPTSSTCAWPCVAGSVALGYGDDVLRRRAGRGRPAVPPRLLRRAPVCSRRGSAMPAAGRCGRGVAAGRGVDIGIA